MTEVHKHKRVWWKSAVFYQIYPSSFQDSNGDGVGDLRGIINRLDYLQDLGVDAIWVSPHYASPEKDMGYDISDYRAINPKYGTMADCDDLIDECHKRGMKIVFDLVVNHSSTEHAWFKQSRSSRDNPYRDYYIWRDPLGYNEDGSPIPPSNWRAAFGGSTWEWDEGTKQYYLHLFDVTQADLNWESEAVRKAIYEESITFWLDKGVDGFRIDTCNLYSKRLEFQSVPVVDPTTPWQRADILSTNGPRLHEFLKEMNRETFEKYGAVTIGEYPFTEDGKEILAVVSEEAKMLSMVFQFEIAVLDHGRQYRHLGRQWTLPELKGHLDCFQMTIAKSDGWTTNYMENHDQARSISRYASDLPEYRIGAGKMLAIYLLTLTGTPFIYQGQEIGMINAPKSYPIEDYQDVETIGVWKELNRAYPNNQEILQKCRDGAQLTARDHARMPMQWTSDAPHGGFSSAQAPPWQKMNPYYTEVNVAAQLSDPNSVLGFYKRLLALRKEHNDLFAYGQFTLLDKDADEKIVWLKDTEEDSNKQALIVLNWTKKRLPWVQPQHCLKGEPRLFLSSHVESSEATLEPFEGRIYFINL